MLLKIIVLVVIAAWVAPLFIEGPGGEPLRTLDDWFESTEISVDKVVVVYKWQDGEGNWHYTDELPEGVPGEVVSLDEPINVLPPPGTPPTRDVQSESQRLATAAATLPGGLTVSPDQMGEMMETVGNLQQDLDDRPRRSGSVVVRRVDILLSVCGERA